MNKLKNESSPYLLQHTDNPVNWYPWCEEAFRKAKDENKPIFLSIGYSTCHWCHVMAHESFENEEVARLLNENYISIKVDREERPDIDSVYMSVCQAFTGSGGWPMSIFMTWDKKPFFAGTYFPIRSHYGILGFTELLTAISEQWKSGTGQLIKNGEKLIEHLQNNERIKVNNSNENYADRAVSIFSDTFDKVYGGFGSAPKFPTPHDLIFLMLYSSVNGDSSALKMAEKTLVQMRKGGIFDHIGYGFSRYSTDKYYLVPHFEKMLYDNALLIIAYSTAFSVTGNKLYLDTAEKTAEYVLREMTDSNGGFYSAQDADSEGVEGKYYTFGYSEIIELLSKERGEKFTQVFDITERGNFEGANIPNLLVSGDFITDFADEINVLYEYRKKRYSLHLDDKILLSWNSLMIAAFSMLYRASEKTVYLDAAKKAQIFIECNLCDGEMLYASYRNGKRAQKSFLDDYAFYTAALIELYNSTFDKTYLEKAERFCNDAVNSYADVENGGYFLCNREESELFINPKEIYDGAVPSGNAVILYGFVRLYQLTGKSEYAVLAEKQIDFLSSVSSEYPSGHCMFLISKILYDCPPKSITVAIKEASSGEKLFERIPFFANVKVVSENEKYPIRNDKTTYYVCKNNVCQPPANTFEN